MFDQWNRYRSSRFAAAFGVVIVLGIISVAVLAAFALREKATDDWKTQMSNSSLLLAEHAYQTMASAYLALDGIAEKVSAEGVTDQESFRKKMSTPQIYSILKERTASLPQVDVATVVAGNGEVLNFTLRP